MNASAPTVQPPPPYELYNRDPKPSWPLYGILLTSIPMSLLVAEIILGNLLVIVAVLTQRYLRTPSNMIILSLAVADLAVGVFILPFNIADMLQNGWRFGNVLCRIWLTSDVTLCSTSILHISAIAVDRFRSINEGVTYAQSRTIKMSLIVCVALWFIALWIASAPVLGWNDWVDVVDPYDMQCLLTRKLGYIIHSASGAFFIPAIIMVGLCFRIYYLIRNKLWQRSQMACLASRKSRSIPESEASTANMNKNNVMETINLSDQTLEEQEASSGDVVEEPSSTDATKEDEAQPQQKKSVDFTVAAKKKHSEQIETILRQKIRFSLTKERKAAKTLGVIIGAFIICWTPFTLVYLISGILVALWPNDEERHMPFWLFQTVTWLGYVNSGLNPIIYTIYNPDFKRAFVHIWNKIKRMK